MASELADLALREITETKRIVEAILTSDDSFDYTLAKRTIEELRVKIRVLGRVQACLANEQARAAAAIRPFPQDG